MALKNIEAVYPLTPLQEGMLYHGMRDLESGAYHVHYTARLEGDLIREHFRRAWQLAAERHAVMRTFFTWQGRERPLQVVRKSVELPFQEEDWREIRNL